MEAWLTTFCPEASEITLPDGRPFSWELAMPLQVFIRELRKSAKSKARGLHPFMTAHLQALPDEHPVLAMYHRALTRCLNSGVYRGVVLAVTTLLEERSTFVGGTFKYDIC